jgi:sec-independent protein translocase protein TatA
MAVTRAFSSRRCKTAKEYVTRGWTRQDLDSRKSLGWEPPLNGRSSVASPHPHCYSSPDAMHSLALISNLAGPEGLLIFLIILLLFGAKKLPELAKGLGQAVKEFSKAKDDVNSELSRATHVPDYSNHPYHYSDPSHQTGVPSSLPPAPAPSGTATSTGTGAETTLTPQPAAAPPAQTTAGTSHPAGTVSHPGTPVGATQPAASGSDASAPKTV